MPTARDLSQWLDYQSGLNPRGIDLGLERIGQVWQRLGAPDLARVVVSIGGTNGKGSCAAMTDAIARRAGYRSGVFTSPHLLRYNERIRIDGDEATDQALCDAFETIEQARGDIPLTYFEFGTLAAFLLFAQATLDLAILEVGLGGRLDAVNLIDADAVLITGVDLDHQDWLGDDIEAIAFEKAGIFRAGRPAIYAGAQAPESLVRHAGAIGARLQRAGRDFDAIPDEQGWRWQGPGGQRHGLPLPALRGRHQLTNAAGVLALFAALDGQLPVDQRAVREGLLAAHQPGRFEVIPGSPTWVLDVAHNPQASRALADNLSTLRPGGRVHAVIAMLEDKDVAAVQAALSPSVDGWFLAGLDVPRGLSGLSLMQRFPGGSDVRGVFGDVGEALAAARRDSTPEDLVLVFGSFYTVAAARQWLDGTDD